MNCRQVNEVRVAVAIVGALLMAVVQASDVLTVDFSARAGKIRRELFSSGLGGQLTGPESARLSEIKALNLHSTRTHDWALWNAGQRICDTHFVFPLLHADTEDARNYFFGPTDEVMKQTVETLGLHVMYRMGTSIESVNARRKAREWMGQRDTKGGSDELEQPSYYNSVEPSDWDQYAKALSHIIRHYTQGWANGFQWGDRMEYWELWNEPNDRPGGSWINRDMNTDKKANFARFNAFYVYVLKRLKKEFPHLKFGGPATCFYDEPFLRNLLIACREGGYTPDFISWHGYSDDPDDMLDSIPRARKLCDDCGFKDMELVINEWHYIPYKDVWLDFNKGPEKYAEITAGPNGLVSVESGVYMLQVFMGVQGSALGQNFYYGSGPGYGCEWGIRKADGSMNKTYYALLAFGDLVGNCTDYVSVLGPKTSTRIFGGISQDGSIAKLLVTDYRPQRSSFAVKVKGLDGYNLLSARLLDRSHDLDLCGVESFKKTDEGYSFHRLDSGSAAWLLTFEKQDANTFARPEEIE